MKDKKPVITSVALFAGGFLSALSLLLFATSSLPSSDAQGSLLVYNPENGSVSEFPVIFQKPLRNNQGGNEGTSDGKRPLLERMWDQKENKGNNIAPPKNRTSEFVGEERGNGFFTGFPQDIQFSDGSEDAGSNWMAPSDESAGSSENDDILIKEIEEITANEKELIMGMQEELPGSTEYGEIRQQLQELRDQKLKLQQELKALRGNNQGFKNQGGERLQNIRNKAAERKQIFEKCRQFTAADFGKCLAENLGKQNIRDQFGDSDQFESMPTQGQGQEGFFGGNNRVQGFPNTSSFPSPMQNNKTAHRNSFKNIIDACKEKPSTMKECIKSGMEAEKNRILEEARLRVEELKNTMEYMDTREESSDTTSETTEEVSNESYCSVSCVNGVCTYKGDCKNKGTTNQGNYQNKPYAPQAPKTQEEWRKYNEQYNSQPTI